MPRAVWDEWVSGGGGGGGGGGYDTFRLPYGSGGGGSGGGGSGHGELGLPQRRLLLFLLLEVLLVAQLVGRSPANRPANPTRHRGLALGLGVLAMRRSR